MVIDPGSGYHKNGIGNSTTGGLKAKPHGAGDMKHPSEGAKTDPAGNASDSVSLSSRAQTMARLEAAVADAPDVNESRVAELKTALEQGSYQIDAHSIAEKMLQQDSQF